MKHGKGLGRLKETSRNPDRGGEVGDVRQQLPTDTGNDRGCRVESLCGYRRVLFVVVKMVLFFIKKKRNVSTSAAARERKETKTRS